MLSWLVDRASVVYLLLGTAILVVAALWWMNRRRAFLIVLGGLGGLLALELLVTRLVVTDRQQIERSLWAMANGVVQRKPDEVFAHLARDFKFDGKRRAEFTARTAPTISQGRVQDLYLWQFEFEQLDRAAKKARVTFNVRVTSDLIEKTQFFLVRAEFVLEDSEWKMKTFQLFNPVVDTNRPIPIQLP
jgi:hypothetical protein